MTSKPAATSQAPPQVLEELPVSRLNSIAKFHAISLSGCLEKQDIVNALRSRGIDDAEVEKERRVTADKEKRACNIAEERERSQANEVPASKFSKMPATPGKERVLKDKRRLKVNTSDPADPDVPAVGISAPKKKTSLVQQVAADLTSPQRNVAFPSNAGPPLVTTPQQKSPLGLEVANMTPPPTVPPSSDPSLARVAPLPGATHYEVLNVTRCASVVEIRTAYKQAAVLWHPDKNMGQQGDNADVFRRVQEAFEVLVDLGRRRDYDATHPPTAPPGTGAAASSPAQSAASIPCDSHTISAKLSGRWFMGKRSQQIKGPKRKPQGLTLFYDDSRKVQLVATFGMSNNVRFKPHEVMEVTNGPDSSTMNITSGLMSIQLVLSNVDPAGRERLLSLAPLR